MQGGTRGLRGGTSHSRRKTQAPGGEQEETALGSTRQSRGRQAPGIRQQAAASSGSMAAAGSQSRGPEASKQAQPAAPQGAQGAEKTSPPASQKGPPVPSILRGRRAAFKKVMSRLVCGRRERNGNAVTPTEYKTIQPTQCTAL